VGYFTTDTDCCHTPIAPLQKTTSPSSMAKPMEEGMKEWVEALNDKYRCPNLD